ncbi:hypothetical protein HJG60_011065 [Phyllostomus discolor]|uniref:Uncharacterized protein n=1 Tax=Phyllostomus discolor TaxID=89673 RepID=A0A834AFC9_9CHIR|nr:hypothetical protein HJG60_011065 [Phyllostomus discolor]
MWEVGWGWAPGRGSPALCSSPAECGGVLGLPLPAPRRHGHSLTTAAGERSGLWRRRWWLNCRAGEGHGDPTSAGGQDRGEGQPVPREDRGAWSHWSVHTPLHPSSTHPLIHSLIHPSVHPSSIHPSIHPSSTSPTHSFIHASTHSPTHSFIRSSTLLSIHPSTHPPICVCSSQGCSLLRLPRGGNLGPRLSSPLRDVSELEGPGEPSPSGEELCPAEPAPSGGQS